MGRVNNLAVRARVDSVAGERSRLLSLKSGSMPILFLRVKCTPLNSRSVNSKSWIIPSRRQAPARGLHPELLINLTRDNSKGF